MKRSLIVFITFALAGVAIAQPPGRLDAVRIWQMTEVLELTEEQTATFLPALQIHERALKKMQEKMHAMYKANQKLLEQNDLSQREVDKILKTYSKMQDEMHSLRQDFYGSMSEYLTPEQQLKFIGFENRFRQDLRDYMKDRRRSGSGRQNRRP